MALFALSEERIFGEILYDVVNSTNLNRASPGSKTRAIAAALAKQLGRMYRKFDVNIAQSFLDGASGQYLEFIGDMLGVQRLGAESAFVTSTDKNIKFYVDVGTFGDINNGEAISIPSGTIISTGKNGTGILYTVPYNIILSANLSEAYIGVQAIKTGSNSNLGRGQLRYHTFSNYASYLNDTLKVTNTAEIVRGEDIEAEANYRYRIANRITSAEGANRTAIRLAALSVPGVSDIIVLPYYRGMGSFELLIKSTTPSVSKGLIEAVQEAIDVVKADGIAANVRGPAETGFSMIGTLTFRMRLSSAEQDKIISACTANIIDYVDSLDIGEDIIINEAIERVMSSSSNIKNIGTASKPFDSLYIYKNTRLDDNKVRNTLLGDYKPKVDERIIVENRYAGSTPILFKARS